MDISIKLNAENSFPLIWIIFKSLKARFDFYFQRTHHCTSCFLKTSNEKTLEVEIEAKR